MFNPDFFRKIGDDRREMKTEKAYPHWKAYLVDLDCGLKDEIV